MKGNKIEYKQEQMEILILLQRVAIATDLPLSDLEVCPTKHQSGHPHRIGNPEMRRAANRNRPAPAESGIVPQSTNLATLTDVETWKWGVWQL